jgi:hypothetical protein
VARIGAAEDQSQGTLTLTLGSCVPLRTYKYKYYVFFYVTFFRDGGIPEVGIELVPEKLFSLNKY